MTALDEHRNGHGLCPLTSWSGQFPSFGDRGLLAYQSPCPYWLNFAAPRARCAAAVHYGTATQLRAQGRR